MPSSTVFQSTPPVKAATICPLRVYNKGMKFQSTPPVKAATMRSSCHFRIYAISIHAAREGGDRLLLLLLLPFKISIHAAREGGDTLQACLQARTPYFNPRRP